MKITTMRAAFALLLSLFTFACQNTPYNDVTVLAEFRNDREIGLPVFGMSCPKCANNITHKLIDLTGVFDVKVDMENGFVTASAAPGFVPTREEFVEAVTSAGFTVPTKGFDPLRVQDETTEE